MRAIALVAFVAFVATLGCRSSSAADAVDAGTWPDVDGAAVDAGGVLAVPLMRCDPTVYAADVAFGGGDQGFRLILDTGSTTLAVAASGCADCTAAGVSALYTPGPSALDRHATASSGFGSDRDSSGWSGEIIADDVGFPGARALARVDLVAMKEQRQFLVGACGTSRPEGAMGLATPAIAVRGTTGFFDAMVAARHVPDVFATRFCPTGGTLWIGGYDPNALASSPVYTPMLGYERGSDALAWYTVDLASISVAGVDVPVATGAFDGAMLDTGSSTSTLPPDAFARVTQAITANADFARLLGEAAPTFFASAASCATIAASKREIDAALPRLTMTFGAGSAVHVDASATESYLVARPDGRWCAAIVSLAPDARRFPRIAAHLGAPLLASNVVVFDRAKRRVGFAPRRGDCP